MPIVKEELLLFSQSHESWRYSIQVCFLQMLFAYWNCMVLHIEISKPLAYESFSLFTTLSALYSSKWYGEADCLNQHSLSCASLIYFLIIILLWEWESDVIIGPALLQTSSAKALQLISMGPQLIELICFSLTISNLVKMKKFKNLIQRWWL